AHRRRQCRVMIPASNRQLKTLRFFAVPMPAALSTDEAGRRIAELLAVVENRLRWDKYVYLAKDVDSRSPELIELDLQALSEVVLPKDWTAPNAGEGIPG